MENQEGLKMTKTFSLHALERNRKIRLNKNSIFGNHDKFRLYIIEFEVLRETQKLSRVT